MSEIVTPAVPALLKTPEGQLLEIGTARVSVENISLDFHGDGLQLFKMESPLVVELTREGLPYLRFRGRVYLSSRDLLRLVEITEELLPGAGQEFPVDVDLPGNLEAEVEETSGLFRRKATVSRRVPVRVSRLSRDSINFTADLQLEQGQQARLDMDTPGIEGATVQVTQLFDFGEKTRNYHCSILRLDETSRKNLRRWLELEGEQVRYFNG